MQECNSQTNGSALGSHCAPSLASSPTCESEFHSWTHTLGLMCPCTPHLIVNPMLGLQHIISWQHYPNLLPTLIVQGYQCALLNNIILLKTLKLVRFGPTNLVISRWLHVRIFHNLIIHAKDFHTPYQKSFRSVFMFCNICKRHKYTCVYLLKNVTPLKFFTLVVLVRMQQIKAWLIS